MAHIVQKTEYCQHIDITKPSIAVIINPLFIDAGTKKGENIMKTKVLLAVGLLAGIAASAQAASSTSIVGTKHDLSSGIASANSVHSTTQNQTCVFCHAPHNAVTNKLLWNRNAMSGSGFKIYTSYNTGAMRSALTQSVLGDDSSSLLCLSCHSLTTAADVINNTANSKGGCLLYTSPSPRD